MTEAEKVMEAGQRSAGMLVEELASLMNGDKSEHLLTQSAFDKRKEVLSVAHAKGSKDFRRMKLVVGWQTLMEKFKGRESAPVDVTEFEAYVAAGLAMLPAEAGEHQFTPLANRIVAGNDDLSVRLRKEFDGRHGVDVDEVLAKVALVRLETDKRINVEIDGPAVNCGNEACGFRSVPVSWQFTIRLRDGGTKTITTGHYLAVGGEPKAYCGRCRRAAMENPVDGKKVHFFSAEEAERIAEGQRRGVDREKRFEERENKRRSSMAEIAKSVFAPQTRRGQQSDAYKGRRGQ